MRLLEITNEVIDLFKIIDKEIDDFKIKTGIYCIENCGFCCKNSNIYATIIEFLPLAFKLFHDNKIDFIMQKLDFAISQNCIFFEPDKTDEIKGRCSVYPERGFICRIFGFTCSLDKHGRRNYSACKILKKPLSDKITNINQKLLDSGYQAPLINDYSKRLSDIDFELSKTFLPINIAIKHAIEKVMLLMKYNF
jgi:Fe-S-cluster containining protein